MPTEINYDDLVIKNSLLKISGLELEKCIAEKKVPSKDVLDTINTKEVNKMEENVMEIYNSQFNEILEKRKELRKMIPKYVSAEEYSRQSGLGVEEVKRLCRIGELQCKRTEKGYYKIPVYDNDVVSREAHEKVKQENAMLRTIIANIKAILV